MHSYMPWLMPSPAPDDGGGAPAVKKEFQRRRAKALEADGTRRLPYNYDAERCLLGSLLHNGQGVSECIEKFGASGGDRGADFFYSYQHQLVYKAMVDMSEKHEPIDLVTVTQKLALRNELEDAGGPPYITVIYDAVPTAANLAFYINIVRNLFLLRQLIAAGEEIATKCYDAPEEIDPILDEAETLIFNIAQSKISKSARSTAEVVPEALHDIEEIIQRKGAITGLPTGFSQFDKLINGLQKEAMIVIAARPGMGKTSLAMNIVEHAAIYNRDRLASVGIFSLEMSAVQIVNRMICSVSRVSMNLIQDGLENPARDEAVLAAAEKISQAKIWIDDTPGLSIMELRARARRMKLNYNIDLLVVDYLQLLRADTGRKGDNRTVEIGIISGGIKALAKELKVPIIILSQLNRDVEKREGGKPKLSDLRESGSIEQDADVVGLLARKKEGDKEEEKLPAVLDVVLHIAKNRSGSQGQVELQFKRDITQFIPGPTVDADDMPPSMREETA